MIIRPLNLEDAPYMLEWMHDPEVVRYMHAPFASKTLDDCENFIRNANADRDNLHLAIASDSNEYMGTVSLKKIDRINQRAEFAITVRACTMGRGIARDGMRAIIEFGFAELNLEEIFWCVSTDNQRAIRFYNKNGYLQTAAPPYAGELGYTREETDHFLWYAVHKDA